MEDKTSAPGLVPRLCHIVRWADFNGYGFNLHAEKGKAGQFIGKVDTGSPAEAAGLREGDRIVEVNGINIGNENHQQVVGRVKSGGDETRLLVVDPQTDMHYKSTMTVVRGDLPEVCFMTASRDAHSKSALTNNGAPDQPSGGDSAPATAPATPTAAASPHYPVRLCRLCKWSDFDGYGFNLHAEKDKPGQFIGVVDANSPAERGGLREGDRIVEVNGDNIESLGHAAVIQRVKAGGERAELLVLDREADAYYQGLGVSVSSGMVGVTVITTPPTSSKMGESEAVTAAVAEAVESAPPPPPPEEAVEQEESVVANGHEEEKEEEEEEEGKEKEEEEKEEVIESVEVSAVLSDDAVETKKEGEEEKEEGGEGEGEGEKLATAEEDEDAMADLNAYEQVEVVAAVSCFQSPAAPDAAEDEDLVRNLEEYEGQDQDAVTAAGFGKLGPNSYGMNGGATVPEPEPEPIPAEPEPKPQFVAPQPPNPVARAPEPEPEPVAVIPSKVKAGPAMGGGLELHLSAAEMKERLKARKKQDPRFHKTSFEAKSRMFEKL